MRAELQPEGRDPLLCELRGWRPRLPMSADRRNVRFWRTFTPALADVRLGPAADMAHFTLMPIPDIRHYPLGRPISTTARWVQASPLVVRNNDADSAPILRSAACLVVKRECGMFYAPVSDYEALRFSYVSISSSICCASSVQAVISSRVISTHSPSASHYAA